MAVSKRRRIALEGLESREMLTAAPVPAISALVYKIEASTPPPASVPLDGIISGSNGVAKGQVPVKGRGYVFPLVGVSVQGTFTTSGTPADLNIGGELTLTGRQGSVVIDIGADHVQASQGKGATAIAIPFVVQASVVSGTGRFAHEQASGTAFLELDSVLGGVTTKTKDQKAETLGGYVLSLHLTPPPGSS